MKILLVIVVLFGAMFIAGDATAQANPTDMILDIVKDVLKVIVEFIGDILDEFVRAIKDLIGINSPKK